MAVFTITPANSVVTNAANTPAFNDDSVGADTLTVDASAHLITLGANSVGAFLANTLAWKVTINGWLFSQQSQGIHLAAGNAALSTITIGVDGEVGSGSAFGILAQSAVTVVNSGDISGGVRVASAATITNNATGTISGTIQGIGVTGAGTRTINNAGMVTGGLYSIVDFDGLSDDKITNSGTLTGDLALQGGNNTLTNSGTIHGIVAMIDGDDTIANRNLINGGVNLGGGTNKLANTGTITGNITGGSGNDVITNSTTIVGRVEMGDGNNVLTNKGRIGSAPFGNSVVGGAGNDTVTNSNLITGVVNLGDGTDVLTNSGTIEGDVFGGAGVDTVINKGNGTIFGVVDLEDGDDLFIGGNAAETVRDGSGADSYRFGAGSDTYLATRNGATDGTDLIDGGSGIDTYDASSAVYGVRINIDAVDHDLAAMGLPGNSVVVKNTALGSDVDGGAGTQDTVVAFENVKGGAGSDVIYGSSLANVLEGNGAGDTLFGFGGNDILIGGDGNDHLIGGAGKDILFGGFDGAGDTFWFTSIKDSGPGKAARDIIMDFEDGRDTIHLSLIDANVNTAVDDAFSYLNGNSVTTPAIAFTGTAGELRSVWTATGYVIEGDVNGDGKADFAIDIVDPTHSIVLTAADFVLY